MILKQGYDLKWYWTCEECGDRSPGLWLTTASIHPINVHYQKHVKEKH